MALSTVPDDNQGFSADFEISRADRLRSLRDQLTAALDICEMREIAAIAKQLRETLAELEALPVAEDKDPLERIKLGIATPPYEIGGGAGSATPHSAASQSWNAGPGGNRPST